MVARRVVIGAVLPEMKRELGLAMNYSQKSLHCEKSPLQSRVNLCRKYQFELVFKESLQVHGVHCPTISENPFWVQCLLPEVHKLQLKRANQAHILFFTTNRLENS